MSGISPVSAYTAPTQLQKARQVEESPAEEKTESRAQEAAETAAQARTTPAAPATPGRVDVHA